MRIRMIAAAAAIGIIGAVGGLGLTAPATARPVASAAPPTHVYAVTSSTQGCTTVHWTAPATSGSTKVTGYVLTPYERARPQATTTVSASATDDELCGLTASTTYSVTVTASYGASSSAVSTASNLVRVGLYQEVRAEIASYRKATGAPGLAVAVVLPNAASPGKSTVIPFFAGATKRGGSNKPTGSTQWEIGSVTKAFTGDLFAAMLHAKKIKLSDKLSKYAPKGDKVASRSGHDITLQELITDEAGLPDEPHNTGLGCKGVTGFCNPRPGYTEGDMWKALAAKPDLEPGKDWQYSNFGNGTLGTVLANRYKAGGKTPEYDAALKHYVTGPLKMTHTYLEKSTSKLATGTAVTNGKLSASHREDDVNAEAGGGGLISSLDDLETWVAAELGFSNADADKAWMSTTLHSFLTVKTTCKQDKCTAAPLPFGMAYAWQRPSGAYLGTLAIKDGGTDGFTSDIDLAPDWNYGVIALSNIGVNAAEPVDTMTNHILYDLPVAG